MRKIAIIFICIALLALAGCPKEEGTEVSLQPFIGGTQGLAISFEANAPPTEIFDGGFSPFDVTVRLENKGEFDVDRKNARVQISGIRAQEFNLLDEDFIKQPDEDLSAVFTDPTGTLIQGNPVFVEFKDFNHVGFIDAASIPFTIAADVCYGYGTTAVSKLCVRRSILNPEEGGLCEINENKPVFSSGAPVQISGFRESARSSDKISFSFDINHAGTGNVFERESRCDTSLRRYQERVHIRVETKISGLSCSGLESKSGGVAEGFTTVFGGSKTVTCTQEVPSQDFESPVTIKLTYDYSDRIDTQINVRSSGEQ